MTYNLPKGDIKIGFGHSYLMFIFDSRSCYVNTLLLFTFLHIFVKNL